MVDVDFDGLRRDLQPGGPGPSAQWCAGCAKLLDADGAAISVRADAAELDVSELVWFSDQVSADLDDLQFTLGEGPGLDAVRRGSLNLITDTGRAPHPQWPQFTAEAQAMGVGAVFAFPLQLGALRVGTLTCHRRGAHEPGQQTVDDALALCDDLTLFLLRRPPPDTADRSPARSCLWGPEAWHRVEVHQATGMLSVQLEVTLAAALMRLRAHAYAIGRPITDVARDILARRLVLPRDRARP
ncbi:ANTAR domain-containing protein [Streptomyces sp. NPDC018019]|uniref:ANTAR domain-containing protein n=1 Tax=Streptomyces sp. NPDC018019 TaxID=3365030 RepID=UPI0037A9571F